MEKDQALKILGSRSQISAPGKYRVKVTNCGDFSKDLGNGQSVIAIANFSAHTPYQVGQAKEDLAAGEFAKALNHNLNLSIRQSDYRPAKGEIVDVIVDYITTKDGEQALLCTSLSPIASTTPSAKADFSEFAEVAAGAGAATGGAEEKMD